MEKFEQDALESFPNSDSVLFWFRKADDTLVAVHKDHANALFTHINNIHPDIKWTKEEEVDGKIHMLDVDIQRNPDGTLSFGVFRKPTHTNQYIHFTSSAPLQHKLATVRALTRRASIIPSSDEAKKEEQKRISDALALNGYPEWAIRQGTYKPKNVASAISNANGRGSSTPGDNNNNSANSANNNRPRHKGHISLPYHAGITEPLARHLQQIGISTTVKTRGSLREHLVHPKDTLEKNDVNGVVYYHACAGINNAACNDSYVGETARAANARNTEHFSTSQSSPGLFKSAIMQYAADAQHHFQKSDIKILARDSNWHSRAIRESIYIRGLSPRAIATTAAILFTIATID